MSKGTTATIFTIGYSKLRPVRLFEIANQLRATVVDCRYKPYSRVPGFNMPELKSLFRNNYEWHGHHLGGFGHTTAEGITLLRKTKHNIMLMCMEEAPGDCHRHRDICAPYFPQAVHIFQDEMFTAASLERALTLDSDYQLLGLLSSYKAL